jgi:Flp pilus assembly pilin Flp
MAFFKKKHVPNTFLQSANLLKKLYLDESGAVATEYVIITGLLAIALIGTAIALSDAARLWFWQKVLRIIKY